tara:strand:- start:80 stop:214 length:135 start_codon:yes stop_codon:yes gene_type:complete
MTKKELLDAIAVISQIIYLQQPLRYQDAWLKDVIDKGIWNPEED